MKLLKASSILLVCGASLFFASCDRHNAQISLDCITNQQESQNALDVLANIGSIQEFESNDFKIFSKNIKNIFENRKYQNIAFQLIKNKVMQTTLENWAKETLTVEIWCWVNRLAWFSFDSFENDEKYLEKIYKGLESLGRLENIEPQILKNLYLKVKQLDIEQNIEYFETMKHKGNISVHSRVGATMAYKSITQDQGKESG
ncbi:MAG: hypothetical protein IJ481_00595 [Alphaproteobacteria bacterium]|nr:hypothetical protein [Alphaproteobacteria bacterium]